jgi:hypothetical protein
MGMGMGMGQNFPPKVWVACGVYGYGAKCKPGNLKSKKTNSGQKGLLSEHHLTNQSATPNSHSITLQQDQQRSPILVSPTKRFKQDKNQKPNGGKGQTSR